MPMQRARADGWHERDVPEAARRRRATASRMRRTSLLVPDPASRRNPEDVHGPSEVVDPRAFDWPTTRWRGRPWHEAVIYELHVGTFTPEGTFAAAAQRLPELAELGITAIELMPLADFPGSATGATTACCPSRRDASYGTPDELKHFVDAAHALGLMVLLDVVYNHFGPEGNYLHAYARSSSTDAHQTPWGAAINFDGARQPHGARLLRPQRAVLGRGVPLRRPAPGRGARDRDDSQPRTSSRRSRGAARTARAGSAMCTSCSRTTATRRTGSRATTTAAPRRRPRSGTTTCTTPCTCC